MRTAIYTRYSTDNQTENSTETQVAQCREYASAHGMSVTAIFSDEAKSGMKTNRVGLHNLLEGVQREQFDAVLIYDQSRLSRDIVDWFTLRKTLEICNVSLYSIGGEFGDIQDPTNFMIESVQAVFNQMHVLTTRKKVIDGMKNMATKAFFTGGVPCLGYDVKDKQFVINDYEAHIVNLIFNMYAEGKSYNNIIDAMNSKGYKTKSKNSFGLNSISDLLRNEKYIGIYSYGKTERKNGKRNSHKESMGIMRIKGAIPRIVNDEVWTKVQSRLTSNKHAKNSAKVDYLLSGKIYCGECGCAMCGERRRAEYYYYACSGAKRLRNCKKRGIRKEDVEQYVISQVQKMLSTEAIEVLSANLFSSMQDVNSAIDPLHATLRNRLADVKKSIDNINNAIANGIYSSTTIAKLKDLEKQHEELLLQKSDLDLTKKHTTKTFDEVKQAIQVAANSAENEKLLIDLCVEKIVCYDSGEFDFYSNPCGISTKNMDFSGVAPPAPTKSIFYKGILIWRTKKAPN